jgi:hypothetical protein
MHLVDWPGMDSGWELPPASESAAEWEHLLSAVLLPRGGAVLGSPAAPARPGLTLASPAVRPAPAGAPREEARLPGEAPQAAPRAAPVKQAAPRAPSGLRCLDPRHLADCDRCTPAPADADADAYMLNADRGAARACSSRGAGARAGARSLRSVAGGEQRDLCRHATRRRSVPSACAPPRAP